MGSPIRRSLPINKDRIESIKPFHSSSGVTRSRFKAGLSASKNTRPNLTLLYPLRGGGGGVARRSALIKTALPAAPALCLVPSKRASARVRCATERRERRARRCCVCVCAHPAGYTGTSAFAERKAISRERGVRSMRI